MKATVRKKNSKVASRYKSYLLELYSYLPV